MKHDVTLTRKEKIKRWLELCDFSYKLMEENLTPRQLKRRLARMRKEKVRRNEELLKKLAKLSR